MNDFLANLKNELENLIISVIDCFDPNPNDFLDIPDYFDFYQLDIVSSNAQLSVKLDQNKDTNIIRVHKSNNDDIDYWLDDIKI